MLDNLYENIGGKIKNWAKWMFIVEAIGAIITGLVLLFIDDDLILYGLLTLVCGPVVAWVGSWILYAFGELVEDIHLIKCKTVGEINKPVCTNKSDTTEEPNVEINEEEILEGGAYKKTVVPIQTKKGKYECPNCGCSVKKGQEKCICFSELDWSQIL